MLLIGRFGNLRNKGYQRDEGVVKEFRPFRAGKILRGRTRGSRPGLSHSAPLGLLRLLGCRRSCGRRFSFASASSASFVPPEARQVPQGYSAPRREPMWF